MKIKTEKPEIPNAEKMLMTNVSVSIEPLRNPSYISKQIASVPPIPEETVEALLALSTIIGSLIRRNTLKD